MRKLNRTAITNDLQYHFIVIGQRKKYTKVQRLKELRYSFFGRAATKIDECSSHSRSLPPLQRYEPLRGGSARNARSGKRTLEFLASSIDVSNGIAAELADAML